MNAMLAKPESGAGIWKTIILGLAVLVNLTLIYRLVWGTQSLLVYKEMRDRNAELTSELARYDTLNAALSQEIRLLQTDDRYVERAVRQRLNFVRDNEILYLFNEERQSSGAAANDGQN